jgi:RNA polymerase sigma-70 factor (ECF subfamily)
MIRKLPPAYGTVFNLHAIEGYKHEEIADILGISAGTSKSNYSKARSRLQQYLATYFGVRQ